MAKRATTGNGSTGSARSEKDERREQGKRREQDAASAPKDASRREAFDGPDGAEPVCSGWGLAW